MLGGASSGSSIGIVSPHDGKIKFMQFAGEAFMCITWPYKDMRVVYTYQKRLNYSIAVAL